jgi:hypothetical protein
VLEEVHGSSLRVLVVWEPILPTDWSKPSTGALARIPDPRAMQFWDHDHLVAQDLSKELTADPVQSPPACCVVRGFFWDMAALYPPEERWASLPPKPQILDGPVVDTVEQVEKTLKDEIH